MLIRIAVGLAAFVFAIAAFTTQSLDFIERPLLEQRFKLAESNASDRLVVIGIDAKSLRKIGTWPWKRSLHALLLDRLTAADAGTVIFDIDFSLNSTEQEDALLENALERRGGRTVLAAFRQWSEAEQSLVDVGPLPRFAAHSEVASANVLPESDGLVWRLPLAQEWNDRSIPSIASSVAAHSGHAVRTDRDTVDLWVDYGIRPGSIQQYSFYDVAVGNVDPALLKGRTILVGAVSVELGDMIAAPVHRSLPGVLVQMIAAQSLVNGRVLQPAPLALTAILLLAMTTLTAFISWRQSLGPSFATIAVSNVLVSAAAVALQSRSGVLLPVAPFLVGSFLSGAGIFVIRFRELGLKVISERLARIRSQALMANVAENAFDALITTDYVGRIKSVNRAAERILGIGRAQADELAMSYFYLPSKLTEHRDFEQLLSWADDTGEPVRLLCRRLDGHAFHADLAVTRMRDDDGMILVMRDIDRRVKAELRALRRERELKSAKRRAELANRAKTEFLANMSHELKTPLNAVMGFAEIMQNELYGPLGSPNYLDYTKDIYDSGARLLETVTDVLDFARIEEGKLELREEDVDLSQLLVRMADISRARAEEAGLELSVETPSDPVVYLADERLMKQILSAVISNAVKFNREAGSVSLSLSMCEAGSAVLKVADSGIGIADDQIENCLKAFGQADTGLQRQYEGSGLGLTLAKAYIESHGGALSIVSAPDEGTTVSVTLPAQRRSTRRERLAG